MKNVLKVTALVLLVVMCVGVFAACTPSKDSMVKKLEEAGYSVTSSNGAEDSNVEYTLVVAKISLTSGLNGGLVTCYKTTDDAKNAVTDSEGNSKEGESVVRKGKVVIVATQAVLDIIG